MPFKSESQRRKFYAMLGRGEISKSKVDEWEQETKGKLPERVKKACVKAAFVMGQIHAFEKKAGIENLLLRYAPYWAPAGAGAVLGGPEHRMEGALAGLGGGALGARLLRSIAVKQTPGLAGLAKYLKRPSKLHRMIAKKPELAEQLGGLEKSEWLGRLGGGAGAGYLTQKILQSQAPVFPAMQEY